MKGRWVPHDTVVDYINYWRDRSEVQQKSLLFWLGFSPSKFRQWRKRYGKANEHNGQIPRDYWLEAWEKQAIIDFHLANPLNGYRRLTFMMLDADVVAVSPSSTYRVLKSAGLLDRKDVKASKKGTGFKQPKKPHSHWHIDISYLNLGGTFYFLISVLDGYSRFIVHWEICESMRELDVEMVLQKSLEKFPDAKPRIISDNGPQFIAKDFKSFLRIFGLSHARTSPYYPQSNGKQVTENQGFICEWKFKTLDGKPVVSAYACKKPEGEGLSPATMADFSITNVRYEKAPPSDVFQMKAFGIPEPSGVKNQKESQSSTINQAPGNGSRFPYWPAAIGIAVLFSIVSLVDQRWRAGGKPKLS